MNQRQAFILIGLIREYIRRAQPVGSEHLRQYLQLTASPATVRTILRQLELAGFIYQPHTSAGRVPTDQGYRYYVNTIPQAVLDSPQRRLLAQQLRRAQPQQQLLRTTSKVLAKLAHAVAISANLPEGMVQETGLSEVMNQPEGEEHEAIQELSHLLDIIDQHLESLAAAGQKATVFIGQENPLLPSRFTSLIVRTISLPDSDRQLLLLLIGPKRMPYGRHVALLEEIASIVQHHCYDPCN